MSDVVIYKTGAEIQTLSAVIGGKSYPFRRNHPQWGLSRLIRPGLKIVLHLIGIQIFFVGWNVS